LFLKGSLLDRVDSCFYYTKQIKRSYLKKNKGAIEVNTRRIEEITTITFHIVSFFILIFTFLLYIKFHIY